MPGILTIGFPILVVIIGKIVYPDNNMLVAEMLGGYMAGVTVSGVLWAIFQNNAGGAWDNAKKSFEAGVEINGEMTYKGSEAHKAAVTGDTVGDPFKDTSGPSMNILIKLTCLIGLVVAPILGNHGAEGHGANGEEVHACAPDCKKACCAKKEVTEEVIIEKEIVSDVAAVDMNSLVTWTGRKVGGSHTGTVTLTEKELKIENDQITGSFTVDMNSIACTDIEDEEKNSNLVGHLKNSDFFAVEEFATATFVVTSSEKDAEQEGIYNIKGDLTIKGQTNPIEFPVLVSNSENEINISGAFAFDRTQYGIEYGSKSIISDMAGKFIYDEIEMNFDWTM